MRPSPRRAALVAAALLLPVLAACDPAIALPPGASAPPPSSSAPAPPTPAPDAPPDPADPPDETPLPDDGDAEPAGNTALGTNLDGLSYWSEALPFVDAFKLSGTWRWTVDGQDRGDELDLDEDGWVRSLQPGQKAETILLDQIRSATPGEWQLTWEGSGELGVSAPHEPTGPNSMTVEVGPEGPVWLSLTRTDPADPVRDIRLVPPGGICDGDPFVRVADEGACAEGAFRAFADEERSPVFNPDFLASVRGFGVLRFMDWMHTNGSPVATWDDRTRVESASWAGAAGAPPEVMAELSELLGADPWVTVPHLADDDYVRNLVTTLDEGLGPDRTIWVEFSNEVWNGQFEQARHALARGEATGPEKGFGAQLRWYGERAAQVLAVARDAVDDPARVRRVLASQSANPWVSEQVIAAAGADAVDVLAVAPYVGIVPREPAEAERLKGLGVDGLLDELTEVVLPKTVEDIRAQVAVAEGAGLPLVAYEGGQHLAAGFGLENDQELTDLFLAANRSPRMGELYREYLQAWKDAGGQTFMHFVDVGEWSKWGSWGSAEYLGQPDEEAPKRVAIHEFAEENPRWW